MIIPYRRRRGRRILADDAGIAVLEFGLTLPFLILLGFTGVELTRFAVTTMRVNQLAVTVADNASRAKEFVTTGAPQFREVDVTEVFRGAQLQGSALDLTNKGRIVVSSIEANTDGGQWIHWQRCFGKFSYTPRYGKEGDGKSGSAIKAIGPAGRQVIAEPDNAIVFVEIAYRFEPLLISDIVGAFTITNTAAMFVRDDRDLSKIYNPAPTVTPMTC